MSAAAAPAAALPSRPAAAPRVPLALALVDAVAADIRAGALAVGARLPTEAALAAGRGVSRTVVREAISRLQAAGLVETRHGVGTFVAASPAQADAALRIAPRDLRTLHDVVAVLELRLGLETEAAGLAAQRRDARHLAAMRESLDAFAAAVAAGRDAVDADYRFHLALARATRNRHFAALLATLGAAMIPRARLPGDGAVRAAADGGSGAGRRAYLERVHDEHRSIFDAVERGDAIAASAAMRTHLANSRERRRRALDAAAAGGAGRRRGR